MLGLGHVQVEMQTQKKAYQVAENTGFKYRRTKGSRSTEKWQLQLWRSLNLLRDEVERGKSQELSQGNACIPGARILRFSRDGQRSRTVKNFPPLLRQSREESLRKGALIQGPVLLARSYSRQLCAAGFGFDSLLFISIVFLSKFF